MKPDPAHDALIDHEIYGLPPGDCRTHPHEWDCEPVRHDPQAYHFDPPSPELMQTLREREGCYEFDEDGRDLSEHIWRFGQTVAMHVDEAAPGDWVFGVVLSGAFWLFVEGQCGFWFRPGTVYRLDPRVRHGAPSGSQTEIIVYTRFGKPEDFAPATLWQEAMAEAEALVNSPQPDPEGL